MGLTLAQILNPDALAAALADGYVRARSHPTLPYTIYNTTERAVNLNRHTSAALVCRGLIVDRRTDQVLARPLRRFVHYGHPDEADLDPDRPAVVTDKLDGSLGVLYPTPDGWAVATRGSFSSAAAVHATALLRSRYGGFTPADGHTVLVEIVYPGNRIVIDYGDTDDLFLLGAVDITSGRTVGPAEVPGWTGPAPEVFAYRSLAAALDAPPRRDAAGLVAHLLDTDRWVTLAQPDYRTAYWILTHLDAYRVWRHLVDGRPLAELVGRMPDEFRAWCRQVADQLTGQVEQRYAETLRAYQELVAGLPDGWRRGDFARVAGTHPERSALFLLLDGGDLRRELWQRVRPAKSWTPSIRPFDS